MYATAVGLVLNSLEGQNRTDGATAEEEETPTAEAAENIEDEQNQQMPKERKRFFDKWAEKFKDFLDNAE